MGRPFSARSGWHARECTALAALSFLSRLSPRRLLCPRNVVLNALGRHLAYEVAIGANGMVWVDSASAQVSILICNAILNSEVLPDEQTDAMVERLVSGLPRGSLRAPSAPKSSKT